MRVRFLLLCLSFAGTLLLPASLMAEKLLRWNLQPGQALLVTLDQDIDMTTNVMGNEMQSSADVGMTLMWNVARRQP